jgi:hypothetical protein
MKYNSAKYRDHSTRRSASGSRHVRMRLAGDGAQPTTITVFNIAIQCRSVIRESSLDESRSLITDCDTTFGESAKSTIF